MDKKILIMGAAGRDFHLFNHLFRGNENYKVISFLAGQLPGIAGRKYPAKIAGKLYPDGIPIKPEKELPAIVKEKSIDQVVLAHSDLTYDELGKKISSILLAGSSFWLPKPSNAMLSARKPVVAVCASRTGAGKSSVARFIARFLPTDLGIVRHPMPYGKLEKAFQKIDSYAKLDSFSSSIEELEEYEPWLRLGREVWTGIDYGKLLNKAEKQHSCLLWDGGNNDLPFFKPDFLIVVVDSARPGLRSYPGELAIRLADLLVINKVNISSSAKIKSLEETLKKFNPRALIAKTRSKLSIDRDIEGKSALPIEDAPTVTHGGIREAAAVQAIKKFGASQAKPAAKGEINRWMEKYGLEVLPSLGYTNQQRSDLERSINSSKADLVLLGTQCDLERILDLNKPVVRVSWSIKETDNKIKSAISKWLENVKL